MKSNIDAIYKPERAGDVRHISLDPSKAVKELAWEANYKLAEALEETISTYLSNEENKK
jgi:UDP-glucose 4-epimerase